MIFAVDNWVKFIGKVIGVAIVCWFIKTRLKGKKGPN